MSDDLTVTPEMIAAGRAATDIWLVDRATSDFYVAVYRAMRALEPERPNYSAHLGWRGTLGV